MPDASGFSVMAAATIASAIEPHGDDDPRTDAVRYGWEVVNVTPDETAPEPPIGSSPGDAADLLALLSRLASNADVQRGLIDLAKDSTTRRLIANARRR